MTEVIKEQLEPEASPKLVEISGAEAEGAVRIVGRLPEDILKELNGLTLPIVDQKTIAVLQEGSLTVYKDVDYIAVSPRDIALALADRDQPNSVIYWLASADRMVYFDGQQDVEGQLLIRADAGRLLQADPEA